LKLENKNIGSQYNLINTIAIIAIAGTLFILIVLIIFYGWPRESNRFLYVFTILLFVCAIIANNTDHPTLAKYLICYTPILFTMAISVVNKRIGPIYINDYYVSRIVILIVSILPILLFKHNKYVHLVLTMLPAFLCIIFFDPIHRWFEVGIFQTGYVDETYFLTNFVMAMSYVGLNGFIYSIKKKNDLYFDKIVSDSERLKMQYKKLQDLNREIEDQNNTISGQNTKLKEFSHQLSIKVESRTSELTKLNQELAEQNARLEQFTFTTAHNLKSPVTQIKGLLNLINYENGISKNVKELLKKINASCMNLEEVISDLNKILNIKNDSHIVETFNISEIADHIIVGLKDDIHKKKITVHRKYHAIIEFHSIKAFIYSILFNLINNAVKYSDPTKEDPIIDIRIDLKENRLYIRISDNGVGFDQKMAGDKVFQLYQRFNTSVQGKGLGLYIVKTQIDILNGQINVSSQPDQGTQFEIYIPDFST